MNDRQLKPCVKCGHTDLYAKAGDAWFSCAVCMTMREGLATPWNRRAPAVSAERPGREGWVLVPIDPTGAMIDAPRRIILDDRMRANNGRTKAGVAIDIYRAMLSAVPATPEGPKEQGSSQGLGQDQCADAGPFPRSWLAKACYLMSEPHLSGYRVILGFNTLADAQDAQTALAKAGREVAK